MSRLLYIMALSVVLPSCSGQQDAAQSEQRQALPKNDESASSAKVSGSFPISAGESDLYSAVVYVVGTDAGPVEKALISTPLPKNAAQQVILKSNDGTTFVELTRWNSASARAAYKPGYMAKVSAYWRRDFAPSDQMSKPQVSAIIDGESNVQWSEFLMRDNRKQQELYEQATGMARNMVEAGPEQLQSLTTMKSDNGASIAFLALWANEEGFTIFEKDSMFGDDPYWAPVADNAHWMMRPILIR